MKYLKEKFIIKLSEELIAGLVLARVLGMPGTRGFWQIS
jgi:hypothetical protein